MEVPTGEEVHIIYGDQKASQEGYFTKAKEVERIEEKSEENSKIPKLKPDGEFELFVLDAQQPDHTVKVGRTLPTSLRMQLVEILVQYKDIFAWFL